MICIANAHACMCDKAQQDSSFVLCIAAKPQAAGKAMSLRPLLKSVQLVEGDTHTLCVLSRGVKTY